MKTVLKYIKPHLPIVIFGILFKALGAFTDLAIPRLLAVMIDEDIPTGDINRVYRTGAFMLAFALATLVLNITGNRLAAIASSRLAHDLRHDLFVKTLELDTSATDRLGLASLTSRLTSDTYNVATFFGRMQRMGMRAPMILIGGVIITFTLDVRLALIFLLVLPLVALTVYLVTKKTVPIYKKEQKILDDMVRRVDETASGIRVIKALSKVEFEKSRFNKTAENLSNEEIKAGRISSLTTPVNDLIFYFGFCIVVSIGAVISATTGEEMSGTLLAFMTYFTMVLNGMLVMSRMFVQMSKATASAARIEEVLLTERELKVEPSDASTDYKNADEPFIVFDNVSFSYGGRRANIENLSFTLNQGETLGVIGGTGSGKSTVVKLLMRLYDVTEGSIRIGGRDIRSIPFDELYSMFGVAYQNDFVPRGTVRENIDFFRGISDEEIGRATEISQARDFIDGLEGGLDHEIATRGMNVSGGQRQRLLVSRAVLGDPDILILDDASSALDYKTDAALRSAIKHQVSTTTIIVSQRVASVRSSDKILVLDGGRAVGLGTHDELIKSNPEYRDIAAVQMSLEEVSI